jgi:cytochrome P450
MKPLSDYTLIDRQTVNDPFEYYSRMRSEAPVHFDPKLGAWLVTRYADIQEVGRQPDVLSSELGFETALWGQWQAEVAELMSREGYGMNPLSDGFQIDPPVHPKRRGLVEHAFSAQRVADMEGDISAMARELVDAFIDRGKADMIGELARPMAIYVIGHLFNIPKERKDDVARWSDAFAGQLEGGLTKEQAFKYARELMECHRYIDQQIQIRRERPTDDLISALMQARIDDPENPSLTFHNLLQIFTTFLAAGNHTTRSAIGWGALILAENPQLVKSLREAEDQNKALFRFCEEVLRINAPVPQMPRVAVTDCTVGGVTIPKGATVWLCYSSGNRDSQKFPDADRFQIERKNSMHQLAFGVGIHRCVGAMLARMEMKCTFREIVTRMDNITLAIPAEQADVFGTLASYGLESLPVKFTKR